MVPTRAGGLKTATRATNLQRSVFFPAVLRRSKPELAVVGGGQISSEVRGYLSSESYFLPARVAGN